MFIATCLNIFLKKLEVPTIIWYIITWVIISYLFKFNISGNEDLKLIGEFWIVFLMFTIGLEFSIKSLIKLKSFVFVFWTLQFFVTTIIFYIISVYIFWIDNKTSIIISSWLSLSSTAIVLKILKENKQINSSYGQKIVWILIFQDIIVIPILIMISIFSKDNINIPYTLAETIISTFVLFVFLWLIWKYVLNIFLEAVNKTNSNEIFIWAILLIVIWSSYLAHYLWLTYSIWAFIAWIMIAETNFKHQIESWLVPFRDLLLWIFFINVWIQLDFITIKEDYAIIIILLLWIIILKTLILYLILIFSNQKSTALKTSLSLFQVWEFSIVIFEFAKTQWLIENWLNQILIVVIILSMIITPFIIRNISYIIWIFINEKFSEYKKIKDLSHHIIIIWYWRIWSMLSEFLEKNNQEHIIIENNIKAFKKAKENWKRVILWDAWNDIILESSGIKNASFVIISIWFWNEEVYLLVEKIKNYINKDKIFVKVSKYSEKENLSELKLSNIIVETEKTAMSIIEKINRE